MICYDNNVMVVVIKWDWGRVIVITDNISDKCGVIVAGMVKIIEWYCKWIE
jgi:hypothetical protein